MLIQKYSRKLDRAEATTLTIQDVKKDMKQGFNLYVACIGSLYSQTCIKRSCLGQRKCGLLRQVTS